MIKKIRTKLVLLLIFSLIACLVLFRWMWYQKWDIWYLLTSKCPIELELLPEPREDFFQRLEEEAPKYEVPESEDDKARIKAIQPFFELADNYTAINIYGLEDGRYRVGKMPEILTEGKYRDIFNIGYKWTEGVSEQPFTYPVEFKNGYATVIISFYHSSFFIFPYFVFCLAVNLFLFLFIILYFVNRKMRGVERLKGEILEMALGNLETPVKEEGQDELGVLARELDSLRVTLNEKLSREIELKRSNQELIAALSHDLRTPLTILKGYLEILKLRRNREQQEEYLERCIRKAEDIQELTNRMFEYALVYDEADYEKNNLELERLSFEEIVEELKEHGEFLELAGFRIEFHVEESQAVILADPAFLKRIFNNLFSNIIKYADKKVPVEIRLREDVVSDAGSRTDLSVCIKNHIKTRQDYIESNCIGLKSVSKIVELMDGTFDAMEENGDFAVNLVLKGINWHKNPGWL